MILPIYLFLIKYVILINIPQSLLSSVTPYPKLNCNLLFIFNALTPGNILQPSPSDNGAVKKSIPKLYQSVPSNDISILTFPSCKSSSVILWSSNFNIPLE